ncbi:DUF5602 domain-containing protein [Pseudonocardia cypriaca]|uniref:TTHB210-like domain-containing protein n=1 Tax=Pseudonocardia cypriaca TaxID=882449 RepID=A0A543GJD6_9PSEU|nr:DUF5602 domain-containing protein [Pseudonocardia cypriaca]TQM46200.1 hypothetical protein FB388_3607 [Pseudonocardia cypriaca]
MLRHRLLRGLGIAFAASTALAFLPGCSSESPPPGNSGTFFGPSQPLGNGTVKTYTTLDDGGRPTEIGLRLSPTALDGLPAANRGLPPTLMLDFPDQASATPFDHVMLNWNPEGHEPPELFGKPHFDFHFDMVDMATIESIIGSDPDYAAKAERAPESKYVPQDYVVPPGAPAAAQAVPGMGVHLIDFSDGSLVPGSYDFEHIIINGTWDSRYTFIEPMITREWLLTGPASQQPLKLPQAYQKTAYYPTTYGVHVDEQSKDYVISLAGMTMREAS